MSVLAENLAVLFVDVCDSTRLYHELGDERAHALTAQCLSCVVEATKRNGGQVVKTTGDGAMTTFPTVEQAYRTASSHPAVAARRPAQGQDRFSRGAGAPRAGRRVRQHREPRGARIGAIRTG